MECASEMESAPTDSIFFILLRGKQEVARPEGRKKWRKPLPCQGKCVSLQTETEKEQIMRTATMMPPAQMVVNIEDISLVNDIRRALKLMKGIGSVTLKRNPALSSYERSRADVKAGRVYTYDSLDEFIKEIEG